MVIEYQTEILVTTFIATVALVLILCHMFSGLHR